MSSIKQKINLILSGGGIKGLAYSGVFNVIEEKGYPLANIAGVSSGALAGAFMGSGLRSGEIRRILHEFDFGKINVGDISRRVAAVRSYSKYIETIRGRKSPDAKLFLSRDITRGRMSEVKSSMEFSESRSNILKNAATFSNEGCLFDGDYLEEWVSKILASKGIRTFGDLRGGLADRVNPRGYKVRMTAVDATRAKIVVLPDDMAFYGVDPDKFEVSKAVRMSTSIPFAFKPVEIKRIDGKSIKTHYLIDGGVFDKFPYWLIDEYSKPTKLGFRLDGGKDEKIINLDTPLNVFKALVSAVHDIGVPKESNYKGYTGYINVPEISFVDFSLSSEEKESLFRQGRNSAAVLISKLEREVLSGVRKKRGLLSILIGRGL